MRSTQAVKQGSWRSQVRITSRTILPVIALFLVGGLYLAVNARVAREGRKVLELQSQMEELERQTAELKSNLAELTMPGKMLEQAMELGFRPAEMGDILYVVVPEYQSGDPFVAPSPPTSLTTRERGLSPAYTESLGEWMSRWLARGSRDTP
jgi:cell division protein FtsL